MKQSKIVYFISILGLFIFLIIGIFFLIRMIQNNVTPKFHIKFSENREQESNASEMHETSFITENSESISITEFSSEDIEIIDITPNPFEGQFELPIQGSTGYASVNMEIKEAANTHSGTKTSLNPGEGFKVLEEKGQWWEIERGNQSGWIQHRYAFINLPDVIPSIIYNNTNAVQSIFKSSQIEIPDITGKQLYKSKFYNTRLSKEEYIVPVLYATAKKIFRAQKSALEKDETLVIYEAFRPYEVQKKVSTQLNQLAIDNQVVRSGIDDDPWEVFWFIADDTSNHQMGYAIDVSLAKIKSKQLIFFNEYSVDIVNEYDEYTMQTAMHELSSQSAIYIKPISSNDTEAWKKAQIRDVVTDHSLRLQKYCTDAGLTPLASEWWHFNDLDAREEIKNRSSTGRFEVSELFSESS